MTRKIQSINPATGEVLEEFEELTDNGLQKKLSQAEKAYQAWRTTSFAERKELMFKAGELLKQNAREYGKIMTQEMGKPIAAAQAEAEKCAWVCEYYAENAKEFLSPERIETDSRESYVRFDSLGPVLAVMPWNFPFWQVFRFAAPAIMAGNVGLLKHASNVPRSALAIEKLFIDAGYPEGIFQTLLIGSSKVSQVTEDDRVMAVTLTGSEKAGSAVAQTAGKEIKKTVLELGGSDPFIVLSDADLPYTCAVGADARLQNAGQSCIAAKRFIVEEDILDEFLQEYKTQYEHQSVGDPMDKKTTQGPLATEQILQDVAVQVKKSVEMGAEVVIGGKRISGRGWFYEPTILTNVRKGMPVYDEEVFGPVAAVIAVKDEEEAVQVANDSKFGLGASLWTEDMDKANKLIPRIEAGSVFINGMVRSDPRMPFGGIKKSGYGRELSHYGIKEFVNIKTVRVDEKKEQEGPAVE